MTTPKRSVANVEYTITEVFAFALSKTMPDMSLKVLSKRTAYPEVPPRVEYALTEKGASLRSALTLLSEWSETYILASK